MGDALRAYGNAKADVIAAKEPISVHRATVRSFFKAAAAVGLLWLASGPNAPALAGPGNECAAKEFICGLSNVEDMVRLPQSDWVVASSLASPGVAGDRLYLVDRRDHTHRAIDPFDVPAKEDPQFGACSGRPEPGTFRGHGLGVGTTPLRLYAVNHGGRESVEIFDIVPQSAGTPPLLRWAGCVVAPDDVSINAVAPLPDGGIAITRFHDRRDTQMQWLTKLIHGEPTGFVLEWHAGKGWSRVPESDSAGTNGLLVSRDGKTYFIAEWANRRLIRLSRSGAITRRDSISLDFLPDNIRWDGKGAILVTGPVMNDMATSLNCIAKGDTGTPCPVPYTVARVDPGTLKAETVAGDASPALFGNATVAIDAGNEWWLGTMRGDRLRRVSKSKDAPTR